MAFYSVRVDDEGKEIGTTRQTYRKLQFEPQENTAIKISRNNEHEAGPPSTNNYKTVRYVNSATFIEKDIKAAKKIPETEDEHEESDSSEYNSDGILDGQYQTHIAQDCDTIPLLELNSNESFPSSNNMTYSYRKVCEVTKMIQKPDAYKEWVDAKRATKLYEQRVKEEKKKSEEEKKKQRKMLAEKKYQEWLAAKKNKPKNEGEHQKKQGADTSEEQLPEPIKKISEEEQRDREKNFQAWLEKKSRQEKSIKERLNEETKRERELEKRRREEAAKIYDGWLKTAPQKPKPVPLNRGMFTLKGSVSNLYVNPVPWVTVDSTESSSSL